MQRLANIANHLLKGPSVTVQCRNLSASKSMCQAANTITSHEAEINGGKIFYETAGSGPHNILLLPGALGSTRTDFQPQLSNLDGDKFTIHAWDPPGYGKSRPPSRTWPDKFFNRDAADAAALINHLGKPSATKLSILILLKLNIMTGF